jgi:hypothetical protein
MVQLGTGRQAAQVYASSRSGADRIWDANTNSYTPSQPLDAAHYSGHPFLSFEDDAFTGLQQVLPLVYSGFARSCMILAMIFVVLLLRDSVVHDGRCSNRIRACFSPPDTPSGCCAVSSIEDCGRKSDESSSDDT